MTTATTISLDRPLRLAMRLRELASVYADLGKARLSLLVVVTAAVGFVMAGGAVDWVKLVLVCFGVMLAAGSANALNQLWEIERDARMPRTKSRPLPAGRIGVGHASGAAIVAGFAGVAMLVLGVNAAAGWLAALNILLYVLVYTPLKPLTTVNTLVGAIVGAIPPVIGWVGASGAFGVGAWVLAGVLFAWQMPHFLALAWLYRDQYAAGGFRMLPAADPSGRLTCITILLYCTALVPVTLATTAFGLTGMIYLVGAVALNAWLIACGVRMMRRLTDANARRLFIASVIYLPLLMGLMVIDRAPADLVEADAGTPTVQQDRLPQS